MTNFAKVKQSDAETHVRKYRRENPTRDEDIFYEIYAASTTFEEAEHHFNLDFTELEDLKPSNAIGVRIYIGDTNSEKVNYLVFTKNSESGGTVPDDILGDVFLIKGEFMDLQHLRKKKNQTLNEKTTKKEFDAEFEVRTFHQSCEPDCPEISLFQ